MRDDDKEMEFLIKRRRRQEAMIFMLPPYGTVGERERRSVIEFLRVFGEALRETFPVIFCHFHSISISILYNFTVKCIYAPRSLSFSIRYDTISKNVALFPELRDRETEREREGKERHHKFYNLIISFLERGMAFTVLEMTSVVVVADGLRASLRVTPE
jgi:hypothetical protein